MAGLVGLDCVLNESQIANVTRVFCALKMSLGKLKSYYEGMNLLAIFLLFHTTPCQSLLTREHSAGFNLDRQGTPPMGHYGTPTHTAETTPNVSPSPCCLCSGHLSKGSQATINAAVDSSLSKGAIMFQYYEHQSLLARFF